MTMTDRASLGSNHVPAREGHATWLNRDVHIVKATGELTGGAFGLLEVFVPPGGGPPPHTHTNEDEAIFMLGGALQISIGDGSALANPGDFVFLPRGKMHSFRNTGIVPAQMLVLITPAGIERLFAEGGTPAVAGQEPPPMTPEEFQRLRVLFGEV